MVSISFGNVKVTVLASTFISSQLCISLAMAMTVEQALASKAALEFTAVQGSVSKERRRGFLKISSQSLSVLRGDDKYNRFILSPISPTGHPTLASPDLETNPLRWSLLERYLVEDTHPIIRTSTRNQTITLATAGISDALPTPGDRDTGWAQLEKTKSPRRETTKPSPIKPRELSITIKQESPEVMLPLRGIRKPRRRNGRMSIHAPTIVSQKNMKMSMMLLDDRPRESRPRFTMDDSGLMTPPPGRFDRTFASQIPENLITLESLPSNPPPGPRLDRFPGEFSYRPRTSGPAPINPSLKTFRKKNQESTMNSPLLPEDRALAVERSKHPPPAPTSAEFPPELQRSPAHSSPAAIDVDLASPSSTWSEVSTPSLASPEGPPLPTALISNDLPRAFARPAPITLKEGVRFDAPFSPAYGYFKSPPFCAPSTSRILSPLTPLALFCSFPAIADVSPPIESGVVPGFSTDEVIDEVTLSKNDTELTAYIERGRSTARDSTDIQHRARTLSPPRSTSLLPKAEEYGTLPSTKYDPSVVYDPQTNTRTVIYSVPLLVPQAKGSYTVPTITDSDRNRILASYFKRGRSSTSS